jgi:hypothetical protein
MLSDAGTVAATVLIVVVVVVIEGLAYWVIYHHVSARGAKRIVRRLRADAATTVTIKVPTLGSSWSPTMPHHISYGLNGPGVASYWLDEDGLVHGEFQPKVGATQYHRGPIPTWIDTPPKRHPLARRIMLGYLAFLGVGFIIGYVCTPASVADHLIHGAIGVIVATFVGRFAMLALGTSATAQARITQAAERSLQRSAASSSPPDPDSNINA